MEPHELTVDGLLNAAKEATGLADFGGEDFVEPLERLVASLNTESDLSAAGVSRLSAMYVQLLNNRLRFHEDLKKHPEILDEPLAPPITVVGMPRSGTTKLHRVLASDPALRPILKWQLMNVAPFPGTATADPDPRIAFADAFYTEMAKQFPDLLAGHPMTASDPDEETEFLMEMTFDGPLVPVRTYVPSFAKWRWAQSMTPSYEYLRKLFQYIQWQDGNGENRVKPFILKSPLHLGHIAEFTGVFEGATIVHCHRDPADCVPSFARLLEGGWSMMTDNVDLGRCGLESINLLKSHIDRYLPQRAEIEHRVAFVDAPFRQIVSDPQSLLAEIYQRHGLEIPADAEERISDWEAHNAADRFGKHEYSLERYKLTATQIRTEFADYYERFSAFL